MACRVLLIWIIVGIISTAAYGNIEKENAITFDAVYQYSIFRLDTALVILESKKDLINFQNFDNETAFEFYLAKADIFFQKRNYGSLSTVLETAIPYFNASENKVQRLRFNFYNYSVDESQKIGSRKQELEDLAVQADALNETLLWIDCKNAISRIYENQGDLETALDLLHDCVEKAESDSMYFIKGSLLQRIATLKMWDSDYRITDSIFDEAIKIFQDVDYKSGVASVLNTKGALFRVKGYYKEALRNFHLTLPILEELNNEIFIAYVNNNIGLVFDSQKDYSRSLKYFDTALQTFESIGDVKSASYVITNIGVVHLNLGNYEKAEEYLLHSVEAKKGINDKMSLIYSYNKLGLLYLEKSNIRKAKSIFQKALSIANDLNTQKDKAETLLGLSKVNYENGQLDKSEEFALASLDIASSQEDLDDQLNATQQLATITQKIEDFFRSSLYLKEASSLKDSILNVEKLKEIESLKFDYETNEKRLEQELILQKSEAANLQKDAIISANRKQIYLAGLLLLLSLIMIGLGLKNNIQKRKTNAELSRINSLLTVNNDKLKYKQEVLEDMNNNLINFAGTAAHDLKSPLRTIGSLNGLMSRKYKDFIKPDDQKILDIINNNIHSLSKMIEDLLVFSKIDHNLPAASKIDLGDIINSVKLLLQSEIEDKNAQIILHDSALLLGHDALLTVLFQNIIQNAIKFSTEDRDPVIDIKCKFPGQKKVEVLISDNGIGIDKAQLSNIFKGFQKLHSQSEYEGTGIGLATSKKIVQYYNGQIKAESEIGKGTSFRFSLNSYV